MPYLVPAGGARLLYGAHREKYDCYGQQEISGIFLEPVHGLSKTVKPDYGFD